MHLTMQDWENKSKKVKPIPSMSCVEEHSDHIQAMPEFPEIKSFPDMPQFMRADEYFLIRHIDVADDFFNLDEMPTIIEGKNDRK